MESRFITVTNQGWFFKFPLSKDSIQTLVSVLPVVLNSLIDRNTDRGNSGSTPFAHEAAAAADQTLGALEAYVFCAREDNTNIIPTLMIVCETALPS